MKLSITAGGCGELNQWRGRQIFIRDIHGMTVVLDEYHVRNEIILVYAAEGDITGFRKGVLNGDVEVPKLPIAKERNASHETVF